MRLKTAFILTRLLDIITTLIGISEIGLSLELNPLNRALLGKSVILFIILQVLIVLVTLKLMKFKPIRTGVKIFVIISSLVVLSNLFSLL